MDLNLLRRRPEIVQSRGEIGRVGQQPGGVLEDLSVEVATAKTRLPRQVVSVERDRDRTREHPRTPQAACDDAARPEDAVDHVVLAWPRSVGKGRRRLGEDPVERPRRVPRRQESPRGSGVAAGNPKQSSGQSQQSRDERTTEIGPMQPPGHPERDRPFVEGGFVPRPQREHLEVASGLEETGDLIAHEGLRSEGKPAGDHEHLHASSPSSSSDARRRRSRFAPKKRVGSTCAYRPGGWNGRSRCGSRPSPPTRIGSLSDSSNRSMVPTLSARNDS